MSAPGGKDDDGGSPPAPKAGSHEIELSDDDDPLIILDADAPEAPAAPAARPAVPPPAPTPAPSSSKAAVPAIIDDIPSDKLSPPPPRAQAEYTTEQPSIASDRVREPVEFPW